MTLNLAGVKLAAVSDQTCWLLYKNKCFVRKQRLGRETREVVLPTTLSIVPGPFLRAMSGETVWLPEQEFSTTFILNLAMERERQKAPWGARKTVGHQGGGAPCLACKCHASSQ